MQNSPRGFHHLALRAHDFDASVRFYTVGLGCVVTRAWGEGDGRAVMLDAGNGNALELFAGGAPSPRPEGVLLHFALHADDCDASWQRALQAGATSKMPPTTLDVPCQPTAMHIRIAFVYGPDGEEVEFFQELS
ncbi:MAG TPA: VOC family protein [Armatimonadota bacterium]|jgi:glyoxylase I family protein